MLDILYGKVNPSGKLPETFPVSYNDVPSAKYFPEGPLTVEYRESIYVGYRYYESAEKEVLYPFGFGLSYTDFSFSDLKLSSENIRDDDKLTVKFKVKNTGDRDGAEVCQLYVGMNTSRIFRAKKELREFTKVFLKAGEEKEITFVLNKRAFSYYNVNSRSFEAETGRYTIFVGNSVKNLPLSKEIRVTNTSGNAVPDYSESAPHYFSAAVNEISEEEFVALYGRELPPKERAADFVPDLNCSFDDMQEKLGGRVLHRMIEKATRLVAGGTESNKKMAVSMFVATPLRATVLMSGGLMTTRMAEDLIKMGTGHFWKGLGGLIVHSIFKGEKKKQ